MLFTWQCLLQSIVLIGLISEYRCPWKRSDRHIAQIRKQNVHENKIGKIVEWIHLKKQNKTKHKTKHFLSPKSPRFEQNVNVWPLFLDGVINQ